MLLWTMRGRVKAWLACADSPAKADLIFALAGRRNRKACALHLFYAGLAPRLLLSTGRFELRRFGELDLPVRVNLLEMASGIAPAQRHFFVSFEAQQVQVQRVPVGQFGTLSEIEALADWLQERPSIGSVLIVSSGAHLRRVRLCCEALLPERQQIRLIASDADPHTSAACARSPRENDLLLSELAKVLLYRMLLALRGLGLCLATLGVCC